MKNETITETVPRLYVGTYAKYNNGSIQGKWMDLEDYPDKDSFLEACAELHADEEDPEFMFQDYEGFPNALYDESTLIDELWDWLALDEHERRIVDLYDSAIGFYDSFDFQDAIDSYHGEADSEADFAEEFAVNADQVPETANWIVIDWQASWDCNLRHDFVSVYSEDTGSFHFFCRN
jgi:antirestriction protein